ncbi:MAG: protein kinase [Anaerolineae bacterium]|nr:protein kinase [Anaerolineae bacterium]
MIDKQLGGRYALQEELGRGGMGVVYRAFDTSLRRQVAVKVLASHLAGDPLFVQRFHREAIAAGNLHHNNIVTIYDVGVERGAGDYGQDINFIIMQFVEGESLDQWLRRQRRPMPLADAALVVHQIGDALQYAHDQGMVHRDVKPSNVMLSDNGHVTLMDFGLVRAGELSQLTQSGSVLGTPAYMAPEQITGATVDRRADVYAFGVVIYELLIGQTPFVRTTPMAVAHAHVYDPPPPLREKRPDLPPSVEAVVMKALSKEPSGRYNDAGPLAADFDRVSTGQMPVFVGAAALGTTTPMTRPQPARGTPSSPPPPPARTGKSGASRLWLIATIVALLFLAAVAAYMAFSGRGAQTTTTPETPIVEPEATASPLPVVVLVDPTETGTPQEPPSTDTPVVESTTHTPIPVVVAPTATPDPTATPVSTATPAPTETPTSTPAPPAVLAAQPVNLRSGPDEVFDRVGELQAGDSLLITGRNSDGSWLEVQTGEGALAWVLAQLVDTQGDLGSVALASYIPQLPTSTPPPAAQLSGRIVFARNDAGGQDGASEIYRYDLASGTTVRLTNDGDNDWIPRWSPDGRRIAFTSNRANSDRSNYDIWAMNADGSSPQRIISTGAWDDYASWSPATPGLLAFSTTASTDGVFNSEIHVSNGQGEPRRITYNTGKDEWPSWSPDGQRIVHSSEIDGSRDIVITEVASGATQRIYGTARDENEPAWSPDGRWIVFSARNGPDDPAGELMLMAPDGSQLRRLTGVFAGNPSWSPDSRWVIFARTVDSNGSGGLDKRDESDLWAVSIDTQELVPVLEAPGSDSAPSWTAG